MSGSIGVAQRSIYYATGASSIFQMRSVAEEFERVYPVYGHNAKNHFRLLDFFGGCEEVEAQKIYLVGNDFTAATYSRNSDSIRLLPGIALGTGMPVVDRGVGYRGDGILWMGSKGLFHKGLHIAAEVARLTGKTLHAVGVSGPEAEFATAVMDRAGCSYKNHGFVSIDSTDWKRILAQCTYVIGCSVSEGMSTGILTAAKYGLIPVTTNTCGVDVGVIVPFLERETLVERLADEVYRLQRLDLRDRKDFADRIVAHVCTRNSESSFISALAAHLSADMT